MKINVIISSYIIRIQRKTIIIHVNKDLQIIQEKIITFDNLIIK